MRFGGTAEECAEVIAAVDSDLGLPRTYTQADIDSGLVVRHGGGRHVPVENLRTETAARPLPAAVDENGDPVGNARRARFRGLTGDVRKRIGHARVLRVINRGDATLLRTLPGINAARATRIIAYRTANGRFTAVEDLTDVGIPAGLVTGIVAAADARIDDADDVRTAYPMRTS